MSHMQHLLKAVRKVGKSGPVKEGNPEHIVFIPTIGSLIFMTRDRTELKGHSL